MNPSFFSRRIGQAIIIAFIAGGVLIVASGDFTKFFSYTRGHLQEQKASVLVALLQNATTTSLIPVYRVADGDTIDVSVRGGVATVRLLGINTPEVVDPRKPVECFGPEASAEAHGILDGGEVHLELDPSQDVYDKYGRVLAYVYLPDGTFFNKLMIEGGFAREYTYHSKYKYQQEFRTAQKSAKSSGLGLWAPGVCN